MRVGLAIDGLSPQLTGIGRYNWMLAKGLAEAGDIEELAYFRFGRWFEDPSWFLRSSKPERSIVPAFAKKIAARKKIRSLLFHSPNYFLPPQADLSIVTIHDLSVFRFPEMHPAKRIKEFEKKFDNSLRRATHVVTDSEFIRQELAKFSNLSLERITCVPLGVANAFHERDSPDDRQVLARYGLQKGEYLLCVATLEPRKSLETALAAFQLYLERSREETKLVIIGALGWKNDALLDKIAQAVQAGYVNLLGYVPEPDLPILYSGARLFLYPSIYEGFGLPPIEAMACGVPTVVSNRSSLPEVTKGAAMLVDPDDVDGFARVIENALADDKWRAGAIEAGLKVAAGYTWENCVEETVDVYRKVWAENV